ncbi:DUF2785 domain-containing protein [Paenibacillus silvae]|jgi:hypothetical protein|uniref:DUF2785 domain-containing protein n=1 Tax=Paenibacillus TaxID=44249 RepID=UPI001C0F3F61|nr:DUF2785 domain-containing protein [Paenibacillus barcinonensis]MBU5355014.1 DUF2785 domain-containing protein [Paenibacillus barcinonensis]
MDALTLKHKLQQLQSANLSAHGIKQPYDLALHMMQHIGSPDPVLRDELIYITMATWIGQQVFSDEQLKALLLLAMDEEHLFYRIGEQGTDSVFTRSFSVLLLPPILGVDRQRSFLNEEDNLQVKERLVTYLGGEKDVRGYVEGKGWAHAPAHAADAVEDLAQSPYLERAALLELLHALTIKVMESNQTYIYDEDQRMAQAAVTILGRNLLEQTELEAWVKLLQDKLSGDTEEGKTIQQISQLSLNIRMFMQSLYFSIRDQKAEPFPLVRSLLLRA